MGFNVHMYIIKLARRGLYILEGILSFGFPTNQSTVKSDIFKLIDGLSLVEASSKNILIIYKKIIRIFLENYIICMKLIK